MTEHATSSNSQPLSDEELTEAIMPESAVKVIRHYVNRSLELQVTIDARDAEIARLTLGIEAWRKEANRYKAALDEAVMLLNEHQLAHGTAESHRHSLTLSNKPLEQLQAEAAADVWRTHRDTFLAQLGAAPAEGEAPDA